MNEKWPEGVTEKDGVLYKEHPDGISGLVAFAWEQKPSVSESDKDQRIAVAVFIAVVIVAGVLI